MRFKAHDYQMKAIGFILNHQIAAVWLGCGLGKTVITLTALKMLKNRDLFEKTLVIAPKYPALTVWGPESLKWDHLNDLRFSIMTGTKKQREKAFNEEADIYVINRENVPWLVDYCKENKIIWPFKFCVIDELSSFKNPKSKRLLALLSVRPYMKRLIGLTGTPTTNGLMDLWSEYRLLDMGERLGRYITSFRNTYFNAYQIGDHVFKYTIKNSSAERAIYDKISDVTLSMKTCDYLKMPNLIVNDVHVHLDEKTQEKYEDFKRKSVLELILTKRQHGKEKLIEEGKSCSDMEDFPVTENEIALVVAESKGVLAGKLCQFANGAIYIDNQCQEYQEIHSKKTEALQDLIESHNGQPVLVCYWFKHDRERISKVLDELGLPIVEIGTKQSIEEWNEGKYPVALIHPARAGHGLNLQKGGSSMIWFSLTWSLELYQQTIARIFRQGQENETVTIHRIITDNTYDELIAKVLNRRENVQDKLLNAMKKDFSSILGNPAGKEDANANTEQQLE